METKTISLFSSTMCQLNCKYCDYDNNDADTQKSIIEYLKSGRFIEDSKKISPNLEFIGLWGAEPTFTLDCISDALPKLKTEFPSLKEVGLSTNLVNPEPLKRFLYSMKEVGLKSRIQFSVDGTEAVMKLNRCSLKDTAYSILDNMHKTIDWLMDKNFHMCLHPKITWHGETFKYFAEDTSRVEEHFVLMTDIHNRLLDIKGNTGITNYSTSPTLAIPGYYTTEDCKNFKVLCDSIQEVRSRRKDLRISYPQESPFLKAVFSSHTSEISLFSRGACSAGNGSLGINEDGCVTLCQRPFQLGRSYKEDFSHNSLCVTDEDGIDKLKYVIGGTVHYPELSYSIVTMMIYELAEGGFIPPVYKENKDRRNLLAMMGSLILACYYDNIIQGSVHLRNMDLLRMWGYVEYEKYLFEAMKCNKDC